VLAISLRQPAKGQRPEWALADPQKEKLILQVKYHRLNGDSQTLIYWMLFVGRQNLEYRSKNVSEVGSTKTRIYYPFKKYFLTGPDKK
jgi:hypothetical protein